MKTLFYLLLSLTLVTSCKTKQIALSLNLEEGKEYVQNTVSNVDLHQTIMGQEMEIDMAISGKMTYLVNAVNGDIFDITASYNSMRMDMSSNMFDMSFDSESDDENNPFNQVMSGMTGKAFDVSLTNKGKVEKVENIDKLFASMLENLQDVPEAQRGQLTSQLENTFGKEAFKANLESGTAIFPEQPVKVGDTWTIDGLVKSTFDFNVSTDYTLVENNKDYYLINGVAKLSTPENSEYKENNGMMMRYDFKGDQSSVIKLDKKSGWVIESTIKQNLSGKAHIQANDQLPNGMELPMNITSETVIKEN